jgi:hypothetical protein
VEMIDYLRSKYLGRRMPVDFIKEFNVFKDHPSIIQGNFYTLICLLTLCSLLICTLRFEKLSHFFPIKRQIKLQHTVHFISSANEAAITRAGKSMDNRRIALETFIPTSICGRTSKFMYKLLPFMFLLINTACMAI